ncbi:MAG: alpha/beta hydrolase [Clostridia bacterium]
MCYQEHFVEIGKKDKAIILIPGLYGSALMDPDSDLSYWSLNLDAYYGIINKGYAEKLYEVDEDQNFLLNVKPADMNDADSLRYSLLYVLTPLYKEIKKELKKEKNDEYEVLVWQYDWRQSNEDSANELEKFINDKGYDKVILAGHSMGGVVISNYLTKKENRDKVELFVPICSPLLGAGVMMYYQTNECEYAIANILGKNVYQTGCNNMSSIHQMFSVDEIEKFNYNSNNSISNSMYTLDGENAKPSEIVDFLATTSYLKNRKGDTWKSITNLDSYHDRLFYTDDEGMSQHISHKVNTFYVVGTEVNTFVGLNMNTETVKFDNLISEPIGDGLLIWYSGTAGTPIDSDNVYTISGVQHYRVPSQAVVVKEITSKISEMWN